MRNILAIMCGLVVLFMGGCAVILLVPQSSSNISTGPLMLIPIALVLLNLLVLGGLLGWNLRWQPAFYVLGVIDLLVAVGSIVALVTAGSDPILRSMSALFVIVAVVFAFKGIITFIYAKKSIVP